MFTNVKYIALEAGNPASVDLNSGTLFINKNMWPLLNPEARKNILLHELGHYVNQTECEFTADKYAFDNYMAYGGSPKASVKAISDVLSNDTPEQMERLYKRIEMAQFADKAMQKRRLINYAGEQNAIVDPTDPSGNTYLLDEQSFNQVVSEIQIEENALARQDAQLTTEIASDDEFIAATAYTIDEKFRIIADYESRIEKIKKDCEDYKRAKKTADCKKEFNVQLVSLMNELYGVKNDVTSLQSAKTQRQARKNQKVATRSSVKTARTDRRRMLAEARAYKKVTKADGKQYKMMTNAQTNQLLAAQGIDSRGNMVANAMDAAADIGNSIASIWGGGTQPTNTTESEQNSTIIIIVIAIVLLIGLYFFTQKGKK